MPTVLEFFQWCFYAVVGSIIVSLCLAIVGIALIELRNKWPR